MTGEYMDYYLEWDCPACDETNYQGITRTFIRHKGLPVIAYDDGAQQSFTCSECGAERGTRAAAADIAFIEQCWWLDAVAAT